MSAATMMSLEELLAMFDAPDGVPLAEGWWTWEDVQEAFRVLSRRFIERMPPYPDRFHGRGVVICAGGDRLFANGYVCARMLRHLGCTLPVQFWHLDDEIDEAMRAMVAPLGVACVNARDVDQRNEERSRRLGGWELKPFALLNCPYQEVLLLDADNVPVVEPTFLFETDEYQRTGAIFWPDYSRLEPFRDIWRICEVEYRDEPEFESGQLVSDKCRCWEALNLAMHYNNYSDFYYRHVHGDKETFHLAFHRVGKPYAMPPFPIHALDATMCQHDFDGRRIFQHRNLDKWQLDGQNRTIHDFWFEDVCRFFLSELRARWSGRVFWQPPPADTEGGVFAELAGKWFDYHRVGHDRRLMELRPDGTIGEGAAACERFWSVNKINGAAVLTLIGETAPTCHLIRHDGFWQGRWLRHERMLVELRPATDGD